MGSVTVGAHYELPRPILASRDVFRPASAEPFGPHVEVQFLLPESEETGATWRHPALPGVAPDDETFAGTQWISEGWGNNFYLRKLGMHVRCEDASVLPKRAGASPSDEQALTDYIFSKVDGWFDRLRSWIEVCTAQDLDHEYPLPDAEFEAAGLTTWSIGAFGPDPRPVRDRSRMMIHTREDVAATRLHWLVALKLAGREVEPPAEHLIMRDARAAYMRGRMRRTVLEAAMAAEISMNGALKRKGALEGLNRPPEFFKAAKLARENGLLVEIDESAVQGLRKARNSAIHEGLEPPVRDGFVHLQTAQLIVEACNPVGPFVAVHLGSSAEVLAN